MSKASKTERAEAYRDHRLQLILSKFLSGEITKLDPVYDANYGYRYPLVEAVFGDPVATEEFLTHLYDIGVLKRQPFDKMINCPKCGSANVSIRYCCPYCRSSNIKKSSLIEHIPCGYIDTESHFKKDDKLVCPRCHSELNKPDVNYRKAGIWCSCNDCGKSFDIAVPSHFCRVCSTNFTFEDAVYRDVYSYSLNEEIMKEAGVGYILVAPIREFLRSRGFTVESPGFLKGKSGASHMFDVTAWRGELTRNVVVIDLATSADEPVSEQSIIAMFAKTYDVAPDKACLIAIPKMSDNGRKLAGLYNIHLIEAKNQNEAIKSLEICVATELPQPPQPPPE
jgi:transcription elongation factor Elf1